METDRKGGHMQVKSKVGRLAAVFCAAFWSSLAAQTFPSRPITLVVPFPPGGVTDPVARFVGQKVSESVGQQVVVENKPGAGGLIGAETVKRAPADGYRSEEHTSELQSLRHLVCRLLLEKKKRIQ